MTYASVLVLLALLVLDAWAIWNAARSSSYSTAQRIAQGALVVLLPLLGACVVLYFARGEAAAPSGHYPTEHTDAEDVAYASDYDISSHE